MDNFMFQKLMNVKKEEVKEEPKEENSLEESNANESSLASHGVEILDVSNDEAKRFEEERQEEREGYSARKNQE